MASTTDWQVAFEAFRNQFKLPDDGIGAFAVQLRFDVDDLQELAAESIVGGGDDKCCDVFFFDHETGVVVLAQCYLAKKNAGQVAPSGKAADLNTAVAWIFSAKLETIPKDLRDRASELRSAISAGNVTQIHLWFVHNLDESVNVEAELKTVEANVTAALKSFKKSDDITVFHKEVGQKELDRLYSQAERAIIVTSELEVSVPAIIETCSDAWSSVTTLVPGKWLAGLFEKYGTDLFSANLRGYLGSRESDANINNGIKKSAKEEPNNFAIYNNGVTAITLNYTVIAGEGSSKKLKVSGMSIVNGAQTTGSLANVTGGVEESLLVPIRFIRSNSEAIVESIVRFNNSQNKIEAADFRSGDAIQQRLRGEFEKVDDAEYEGGRRGGVRVRTH